MTLKILKNLSDQFGYVEVIPKKRIPSTECNHPKQYLIKDEITSIKEDDNGKQYLEDMECFICQLCKSVLIEEEDDKEKKSK